ncbi:MAG TPA: S8/S53 family peptidase [Bacteroidia bacterium]|nr:S8/S53 family peptidase [Bacteroidia bacterium]
MKKQLFFTFSLCFTICSVFGQIPVKNEFVTAEIPEYPVIVNPGEYVPNQLLVMLQPGIVMGELEEQFSSSGFVITKADNCAKSMRIWNLTFADGTDLAKALATAKTFSAIEMAQYNHYVAHRSTIPNDPQFGLMWDMNNTGQSGGTPDADIDAPEAWDITTGGLTVQGDTIVVAVIDAGFDLAHEDLNFSKNYVEIPNNGIDDDNNGYIDDYDGWNAYNSNGNITSDLHGTHVCGTVGARGNNSLGVVGVNWGVKIMPIMGADGTEAQVVEAYTYVFDARKLYNNTNGAQGKFVVSTNSSFGVDMGQPSQYPLWCAMYDSMGVVGILSAAATANQNWDIDVVGDIPTACSSSFMLAVTNTTRTDVKLTSAGYGATTIDIGAPGTQITSTIPGNSYGSLTGTSMASPHVAGAVALMYAEGCTRMITDYKNHPDSVALVIRNFLLSSADPNVSLNGLCTSSGRLNIYNALLAVQSYNCTPLSSIPTYTNDFFISELFPNPANQTLQIGFSIPHDGSSTIIITDMLGQRVLSVQENSTEGKNVRRIGISSLSAGVYFVQVSCNGIVSGARQLVVN